MFEDINELAAHVDHASLFCGLLWTEQTVEAGKPVRMHDSFVACQMRGWVGALAIHAELVPRARWSLPTPRPFIAHIAPHAGGLGFARLASDLHFDRRVIRKQSGAGADQASYVVRQALQERG